jgi:hypothetical protein
MIISIQIVCSGGVEVPIKEKAGFQISAFWTN